MICSIKQMQDFFIKKPLTLLEKQFYQLLIMKKKLLFKKLIICLCQKLYNLILIIFIA